MIDSEIKLQNENLKITQKNEQLQTEMYNIKIDLPFYKKKNDEYEQKISELKINHNIKIEKFMNKMKDNDKLVQERIANHDNDKKEFFLKLEDLKESLKINIESQLKNERSKYQFSADEHNRSKIKNEKMIHSMTEIVNKTEHRLKEVNSNTKNNTEKKDKEIDEYKKHIEDLN